MRKRIIYGCLSVLFLMYIYIGCSKTPVDPIVSTNLAISDFSHTFSVPVGGPSPQQFFFTVSSTSSKVLNYKFSNNSGWLQLYHANQKNEGFTKDSILFVIRVASPVMLDYGTYYDTVTITSDSTSSTIEFEVILNIGSEIRTNPEFLEFFANLNGGNPPIQMLDVNSSSSLQFDVSFSKKEPWLAIPSILYNTNDTDKLQIAVNTSGLSKGVHTDTIWVASDSALNSPYPVPVEVHIESWLPQISPRLNNLNDVYFTDSQNGWAVGDIIDPLTRSGFILKTSDGGKVWEEVKFLSTTIGSDSILGGVTFLQNQGWVIGSDGIILYSNNYGIDWSAQTPPLGMKTDFKDVFFISADSGWIVGDSGVILSTSDGGVNWIKQTTPTQQILTGISFVDNMHGWVSGLTDVILVTSDGGVNWSLQTVPSSGSIAGNKYNFKEIMFVDSLHGWAVGAFALIVITVDGGLTWNYQQIPQVLPKTGFLSLYFINSQTGWITGHDGTTLKTSLLRTDDGGATWTNQFIDTHDPFNSIYFNDANDGWVVGGNGAIYHTASGGE